MKPAAMYLSLLVLGPVSALALAHNTHGRGTSAPAVDTAHPDSSRTATSATMSSASSAKRQALKDCIAHERADNSQMSKADARKACENEMLLQKLNQGTVPPRP